MSDCTHCVYPIDAPRVHVFDPKIQTLAYDARERTLEITFKSGQVWQLFAVPEKIYTELRDTSISSFLKFIAQHYKSAPVKTGLNAVRVPESEPCKTCNNRCKWGIASITNTTSMACCGNAKGATGMSSDSTGKD